MAEEGLVITAASNKKPVVGFASIHEGEFVNGTCKPGRLMNRDQSYERRHVRLSVGSLVFSG